MNTVTGVTFERSLLIESSLPFLFLPLATQLYPLPFPGPGRNARGAVPNRCPLGTAARGSPGPPRPQCALGRMRPGLEPARPRDGRYKSGGLRTPALPAGRGHLPAPGSSDLPGHTMTGTPRVTGSRDVAAPTPGKLRVAREPWRAAPAANRAALQSGGFRLPASGEGQAGWGGRGTHRGLTEPRGALAAGSSRRPAETPACGPALAAALSLFLGLSSRVLLHGNRLAPRAGLGATCCKVSGPRRMNPRTGH